MASMLKTVLSVIMIVVVIIGIIVFGFKSDTTIVEQKATDTNATTSTSDTTIKNNKTSSNTPSDGVSDETLNLVLDNIMIRVNGNEVFLNRGSATVGTGINSSTVMRGPIVGKVQTNDGYDVFTDMTITSANSSTSTMHYIALFKVLGTDVKYTSSVVVGYRLDIKGVVAKANQSNIAPVTNVMDSVAGYALTINYLDRQSGEPVTATPTVAKSITAKVQNHNISR